MLPRLHRFVFLASAVVLVAQVTSARAQGRWVDVASGTTERVLLQDDALTFQDIPAFAFGNWAPGTENLWLELLPLRCIDLPDRALCGDGIFIAGLLGDMQRGNCPCTGILLDDVTVQIHYDPARVRQAGARESDLTMWLWDADAGEWLDMPGGATVIPEQDVVQGLQGSHIVQHYVVVARSPTESSTWGAIKAQWQ